MEENSQVEETNEEIQEQDGAVHQQALVKDSFSTIERLEAQMNQIDKEFWKKRYLQIKQFEKSCIESGIQISGENYLLKVIDLVKDRCILLPDFITQGSYFFQTPAVYDEASLMIL